MDEETASSSALSVLLSHIREIKRQIFRLQTELSIKDRLLLMRVNRLTIDEIRALEEELSRLLLELPPEEELE